MCVKNIFKNKNASFYFNIPSRTKDLDDIPYYLAHIDKLKKVSCKFRARTIKKRTQ